MSKTLTQDLSWAPTGAVAEALATRQVSAVELCEAAIARIKARNPALNAVVVPDFDRARVQAKAADEALARGERRPLLGVPMTVKESHNVAGLPTTWGFEHARGWISPADSVGVARLKAAGAVILGKTNIPTSLADWQCANPIYGRTANPWDISRTPGGSSGGAAAALAAGMVSLEFGSDVGGSIRVPAAFCGVFGHKPSFGLIPMRGHAPAGLDTADMPMSVLGPLARCAADLQLALDVLAGPDSDEATAWRLALPPPRAARLADYRVLILDRHPLAAVDNEIRTALAGLGDRLERLGVKVIRHSDLLPNLAQVHEVYLGILNTVLTRPGPPPPNLVSAHRWMDLLDRQLVIRRQWAKLFSDVDVVIAPAHGSLPYLPVDEPDEKKRMLPLNGQPTPYFAQLAWPGLATLGNLPATAMPIGRSAAGLPIGAQLIGPYLEDRTPIAFAGMLEREFGGFTRPPGY